MIVDELVSWGLSLMARGAAKEPQHDELEANWSSIHRKLSRLGPHWYLHRNRCCCACLLAFSFFLFSFSFVNWETFVTPPLAEWDEPLQLFIKKDYDVEFLDPGGTSPSYPISSPVKPWRKDHPFQIESHQECGLTPSHSHGLPPQNWPSSPAEDLDCDFPHGLSLQSLGQRTNSQGSKQWAPCSM